VPFPDQHSNRDLHGDEHAVYMPDRDVHSNGDGNTDLDADGDHNTDRDPVRRVVPNGDGFAKRDAELDAYADRHEFGGEHQRQPGPVGDTSGLAERRSERQ